MAEGQDGVDAESITWLRTAADVNELAETKHGGQIYAR